jgi:Rod binding domain-containing protein
VDSTKPLSPLPAAGATTPAASPIDRKSRAYKAAQEFEAVFLSQMVQEMNIGLKSDGVFGGGFAEETYRSLMYQEVGRQMAQTGGVGIADAVYQEIIKLQGGSK